MADLDQKKKQLMDIYNKYKKIAIQFCDLKDYEAALGVTSAIASLMYQINQIYVDEELESIIKKCAEDYIVYPHNDAKLRNDTIVFYDEFGFDTRGLAFIYLKALCENGYRIVYVTRSYRKGKIPLILDVLEQNEENEIIYLERGSYKEEAETVLQIVNNSNACAIFIYDMPQGIVGSIVPNVLQGKGVISYKINLTDHAFWLGARATDYVIEFRDFGASVSKFFRGIEEDRLIKLPYLPCIDESLEFQGFPFDPENKKIIFSGGGIYKTIGGGDIYYQLVRIILSKYSDVVFWYAGSGDSPQMKQLIEDFPERVFWTEERRDLWQVMKRCYFYLNTYPITGGLMVQYAVKAGKVPMTLLHDAASGGTLNNADILECEYEDIDTLIEQIDRVMRNPDYLKVLESKTGNQVISWEDFSNNINSIIKTHDTDCGITLKKQDLSNFVEVYLNNFDMSRVKRVIYTKRTEEKLNSIGDELPLPVLSD